MAGSRGSKLGAGVPRHAAPKWGPRVLILARAALRPPVASHPSRGLSRPPCTPRRGAGPAPRHPTNRAPVGCAVSACRARHHDQGRSRPPAPATRRSFRPSTPDQPCAGWMRGNRARASPSGAFAPPAPASSSLPAAPRAMTAAPERRRRNRAGRDTSGGHSFARPAPARRRRSRAAARTGSAPQAIRVRVHPADGERLKIEAAAAGMSVAGYLASGRLGDEGRSAPRIKPPRRDG